MIYRLCDRIKRHFCRRIVYEGDPYHSAVLACNVCDGFLRILAPSVFRNTTFELSYRCASSRIMRRVSVDWCITSIHFPCGEWYWRYAWWFLAWSVRRISRGGLLNKSSPMDENGFYWKGFKEQYLSFSFYIDITKIYAERNKFPKDSYL